MVFEERSDYKSIHVLFPGNRNRDNVSGVFLAPAGGRFWEIPKDTTIRKEYNKNLLGLWYYEMGSMHVVTKLDKYVLDISADNNDILFCLFLDDSRNVTEALSNLASQAEKTLSSQLPKIDEIYQNYGKISDGIKIQKISGKNSAQYVSPMMIDNKESPVDHLTYLKYPQKNKTQKGLIMDRVTADNISKLLPHIVKSEEGNYILCERIPNGLDWLIDAYKVWPDVKEQLRLSEKPSRKIAQSIQC